jgi:uncharacterized protein (TIGR03437 family)
VSASAQVAVQRDRIHDSINTAKRVTLTRNANSNARPEYDAGAVDGAMKIPYMQLVLKASPAQQAALEKLLEEQQDPASPNYHKWLTPEQYGEQFGVSLNDLHKLQSWLSSQGFTIIETARGRNRIAFTGTAAQVKNAFHSEIRHYRVHGELHFANAAAPEIPAAFDPLVRELMGLNDFVPEPPHPQQMPDVSLSGGGHALSPSDLATIYDVNPVYNAGYTGTGQKLAIVGQSAIYIADVQNFRKQFGLVANDPEVTLVPGTTDPGVNGALGEADLDLETSGGIAPNTKQYYIYANIFVNALIYAIDQNIAPVISESYHICEGDASQFGVGADFAQPFVQQAASQGISIINSSGDSGATDCDAQFNSSVLAASHGLQVNMFASVPEVTAVGGTVFNEGTSNYWSSTGGALSYIPEMAWNETGSGGLAATGGGVSQVYPKPAWQSGAGFPASNQRAMPDIAFSAAGHDGYFILTNGGAGVFAGTSASTPFFAGVVTLLNQYTGSNGLGNLNPNLYRLAQSTTKVYHDIVNGGNVVPCIALSPNCVNGTEGYNATPGYDLATGLGSIDIAQLFADWSASQLQTHISVSANPPNFTLNGSTVLTVTVSALGSTLSPTGTVSFLLGRTSLGAVTLVSSGSGTSNASLTVFASQFPAGTDVITISYSGDKNFTGNSTSLTVGVSLPTGASAVIPSVSPNPVYEQAADVDGYTFFFTIRLTEINGFKTTLTGFNILYQGASSPTDYSSSISGFFGNNVIQADGTLSASLRTKLAQVPSTVVFGFSGLDGNGHTWTQQLPVQFFGPQISAYISLSGLPNDVKQNPSGPANCPSSDTWFQNLGLEEDNGHAVYLTKFLAGGFDLSDQIEDFLGGTYIEPFGSLLGGICWRIGAPPTTLSYEVDGIDDAGNKVSTTLNTLFEGPVSNPGILSPSTSLVQMRVGGTGQTATSTVAVNVSQGQAWTVSMFPQNRTTSWLVVYPLSGSGPSTLNISASSSGLAPGLYHATLVFQSTNAIPESYNVDVNFVVGTPQITQYINGATITDTGIAPGLIFAIRGTGLGPQYGLNYYITGADLVTNNIEGVQVLVNGFLCPLLYVSQTQINAIAPYEIANNVGQFANIQVIDNGVTGNVFSEKIVATAPGIFNIGNNQAAVRNADGSINGPSNPAARGSIVAIYATGEGQLNPAGVDGSLATQPFSGLPRPRAQVTVFFDNQQVSANNIVYAGTVPTSFEGFFQVNVQIPTTIPAGQTTVVLGVGSASSTPLFIYVK